MRQSAEDDRSECECIGARISAHAVARSRWPEFEVTFQQFADHLDRLHWVQALPKEIESIYLCCACSLGQERACRRLDADYFPALGSLVARKFRRPDLVDDVLQQLRERLLVGQRPRIGTYRGDGPLRAWLQKAARHLAWDLHRRESKGRSVNLADWLPAGVETASEDASALESAKVTHLSHIERAFLEAVGQLSVQDRRLLYVHYVQGLSADELARCLLRDRSSVYRRLNQIKGRVRRWSLARARQHTGIHSSEQLGELFVHSGMWMRLDPSAWLTPEPATLQEGGELVSKG